MFFSADQGRVENADEDHILRFSTAQDMPVVLIQDRDVADFGRVHIFFHILDFAAAADAISGFEMIAVLQLGRGSCKINFGTPISE